MKPILLLAILLSVGIVAAGCATSPDLRQAQQSYSDALNDTAVVQHAPTTLGEAAVALEKARQAKTWEEQQHYAYIAGRTVELARIEASQAQSKMEAAQLEQQRDQLLASLNRLESQEALRAYRAAGSEATQSFKEPVFGFDQAQLSADDKQNLQQVSAFLLNNPDRRILVEGFTDDIGSPEYNLALGMQRAEAVARQLEAEGISPDRIIVRGVGEAFPVAGNDTAGGRRLNRRAELTILSSDQPAEEAGRKGGGM